MTMVDSGGADVGIKLCSKYGQPKGHRTVLILTL